MKILIVEDDLTSRLFMKKYLGQYGPCDEALNGIEAVDLVTESLKEKDPYDFICLDIMMPKLDGIRTLSMIREVEDNLLPDDRSPAKVVITSALHDKDTVEEAYGNGCDAYAWKPIDVEQFTEMMEKLDLI